MAVTATDIRLDEALITAGTAIGLWRDGELDASRLRQRLLGVGAGFPQVGDLGRAPSTSDEEVINRAGIAGRLQEFCAAFVAFAEAHEAFLSPRPRSIGRARFVPSNDLADAMWAGLRPAMALAFVGTFWILADWASPAGWTATILAPLVTARLATMENATKAALAGTILVALATLPYFIVVEVLLPLASGFPMFALAVAPVLFFCAFLMGTARTAGLGFVAGLYFAYSAQFLDRMAYDPVAFANTSIAIILAIAASWLLFAIVAPESPQAARRRFVRVARKAFQRIAHGRPTITLAAFETGMTEALVQLQRDLEPEPADRIAAVEAGVALMSAGRELIRVRDAEPPTQVAPDIAEGVARFLAANERRPLDRATRTALDASLACLTELRNDRLGVADTQAVTQKMVALGAIRDELKRAGEFTSAGRAHTVLGHVD